MHTMTAIPNRSDQIRAVLPEDDDNPHPRAIEMANVMLDIAALGNGVQFRDLMGHGFTAGEITEHFPSAERHAMRMGSRQISPEPDRMAEMIEKARAPVPSRLPLPSGTAETQALFLCWGNYCASRSAMLLDPWSGQRERCLDLLLVYLQKLPLLPRDRKKIVRAVAETLAQVKQ